MAVINYPQALSRMQVLYVEDDRAIRDATTEFLEKKVERVLTAADGKSALEIFEREKPEIVITDIRMPEMDGLDFAKRIRKIDENVQIILTTAYSEEDLFLRAIEVGVTNYVLKPVERKKLVLSLYRAVAGVMARKAQAKKYQTLHYLFDSIESMVVLTDGKTALACNKSFLEFSGFKGLTQFRQEHRDVSSLFIREEGYVYPAQEEDWLEEAVRNPERRYKVKMYDEKRKRFRIFLINVSRFPERLDTYTVSFTDVTDLTGEKTVKEQSVHMDLQTQLPNKREFERRLEQETIRSARYGSPLSLLMLTIHDAPGVREETGGQLYGRILFRLARLAAGQIRNCDFIARYGSETFAVLAVETNVEGAEILTRRMAQTMAGNKFEGVAALPVRFAATNFVKGDTSDSLVRRGLAVLDGAADTNDLIEVCKNELYYTRPGKN